jgi:hypothetical protein
MNIECIKNLIEKGSLETAFEELRKVKHLLGKEAQNEFLLLSAQYAQITKGNRANIFALDDYLKNINKITSAFLSFINEIEFEINLNPRNYYALDKATFNGVVEIELKLNKDILDFTDEEQRALIASIETMLKINGQIKIKAINSGSVKIKLSFPKEKIQQLYELIKSGAFSGVELSASSNDHSDVEENNAKQKEFKNIIDKNYIFIFGNVGVGKTTVITAIIKYLSQYASIYTNPKNVRGTSMMLQSLNRLQTHGFPSATIFGEVNEFEFEVEFNQSVRSKYISFLEIAGENLNFVTLPNRFDTNEVSLANYTNNIAKSKFFLLFTDAQRISNDDVILSNFLTLLIRTKDEDTKIVTNHQKCTTNLHQKCTTGKS